MPELFERYVELQLLQQYSDVIDGNRDKRFEFGMRPDFLLPSAKMIVDAKYKYWYSRKESVNFKDDYQQLSLYGRACSIRDRIMLTNMDEAKLLFIYPKIDGCNYIDKNIKETGMFSHIFRIGIRIPVKVVS